MAYSVKFSRYAGAVKFPLLLTVLAVAACDRGRREDPPPPRAPDPAPAPQPEATGCKLTPVAAKLPMPKRLVAIGDLHGDIAAMRSAFRAAGAIDDGDKWIGGQLVVVQTGDVLDRGDDEQAMLDLFTKLER